MGTGSEGEEEVGREAWDFLEPAWSLRGDMVAALHLAEPRPS